MAITILGIESSCDETSAAVLRDGVILSNVTTGQEVHRLYGGVVPELASRAHEQNIIPVVDTAIKKAGVDKNMLDAVAFTQGPGLLGPLLVGSSFAKAFAMGLGIPLIGINHMQAHVSALFIEKPAPRFPFLCLTVSGGHTQIVQVTDPLEMKVIGETTDDAAGEAFDKSAKLLGLPYPGGPLIDKHAREGNPERFMFPHPSVPGLDFSFSGLKTAILYFVRDRMKEDQDFIRKNLGDICASIQHTIVSILMKQLIAATELTGITEVAIAGGVSANSGLRKALEAEGLRRRWKPYVPKFEYCTDNAAMIANTGYYKFLKGEFTGQDAAPEARMRI